VQDAHVLQVLVSIGLAVLGLSWIARRLRVAAPIVLLLGAVPLGFVPWLAEVRLAPEVVLLLFLPALLYTEALNTSLREIRANLRPIVLSSVVLVIITAAAVAAVRRPRRRVTGGPPRVGVRAVRLRPRPLAALCGR